MNQRPKIADLLTELRPGRFAEIVGQDVIKQQLSNMVAKDTVPNGIMFTGLCGKGKTTLARVLANALSCEGWNAGQYEPCGSCESCHGRTLSIRLIHSSMKVSDDYLRDQINGAKYAMNLWGGRKSVLIVDDMDNLPAKHQRIVRASLDERWPKGMLIVTVMDAFELDIPLRQRLVEMPVRQPLMPELVAWLNNFVLKRVDIRVQEEKSLETLVQAGEFNFRSILKILSTIYAADTPMTVESVRNAAMQNGYGYRQLWPCGLN